MDYIEACKILGVSCDDDLDLIKKCYKSRIKFYHPDNFQGNEEKVEYAEAKKINEAWEHIQKNYKTKNQSENNTDNMAYQNRSSFVYQYKYPVYEPIFTKTTIAVIIIVICFMAVFIFGVMMKPTFEKWELQKKYSNEDVDLMQDFDFTYIGNGYELDTLHSNFSEKLIIPETFDGEIIVAIANSAFENCENLTEVVISKNITTIGRSAFANCDGLKSVNIADNVTEITEADLLYNGAFEDCDNLQSVYIGKGIRVISVKSFSECDRLETIHLQANIAEIEMYAFSGCKNISHIYFNGTVEQWQSISIDKNAFEKDISFSVVCTDASFIYSVEE